MQEYKITNDETGSEVFFVSRAFESALQQAEAYVNRNKGICSMTLYRVNTKPIYIVNGKKIGDRWIKIQHHPK